MRDFLQNEASMRWASRGLNEKLGGLSRLCIYLPQ